MNEREQRIADEYENEGWSYIKKGAPDFLFYKKKDGKITDYKFVEVKSPLARVSKEQKIWGDVLLSANVEYEVISVSLHGESAERGDNKPRCPYCEKQSRSRAGKYRVLLKSIYVRNHNKGQQHWEKVGYRCPNCNHFFNLPEKEQD